MSNVLLVVTFRSHHQFTSDPKENRLAFVKQLIDIANAGKLEQEDGHPECFTFSLPCELDLENAQPTVALNLCNDAVARLVRHISHVLPDAVIISSAGSLIDAESIATVAVEVNTLLYTALSLLGEAQKIMAFDEADCPHVVLSDWQDWNRRAVEFLNEHEKGRSAQAQAAGCDENVA
jgi:hypothetical protein